MKGSVLVIGNTSVVGGYLGQYLHNNCEVRFAGRAGADFFLDLGNPDFSVFKGKNFDFIIHTAADFGGESFEDYIRAEQINVVGTLHVCRLAEMVGAKHLTILSSFSAELEEENPGYNIYALTKRQADEAASLYCAKHNISLAILRPTQLYDAQGLCRKHQGLIYTIIDNAQASKTIALYGANDVLRNYLYIDDLCEIVWRVAEEEVTGTYQCAYPECVSVGTLAKIAIECFGTEAKIEFQADKPDLPDIYCDFRYSPALYERLGYWPKVDISGGIKKIAENKRKK